MNHGFIFTVRKTKRYKKNYKVVKLSITVQYGARKGWCQYIRDFSICDKVVLQNMKTVLSVAHTQLLFRQAGMACYLSIEIHLTSLYFKCQYWKFDMLIIGYLQLTFKVIFLLRLWYYSVQLEFDLKTSVKNIVMAMGMATAVTLLAMPLKRFSYW